ncbi:MAG: hypothetical protein ILP18_07615 [Treponema sp.]|nr:hypothetical protein [Treponema sp.]
MKKSSGAFLPAVLGLLICSFSTAGVYARGGQELVNAGSWVYDAFAALSIESGVVDFSDQAPLSVAELRTYLDEIDYDILSPAGKKLYRRLSEYFDDDDLSVNLDLVQLGIRPELNLEGYYKFNENLEWVYGRYDKKPLLYAPVYLNLGNFLSLGMDLELGINKKQMEKKDDYTNVPLDVKQINADFPRTGYLSTGYKFTDKTGINLRIGMGEQDVGRTLSGSIIHSRYLTGTSWANLEVFNPNIRYNMNVTQLNVDKYMYTHRFDFRFFNKLSVSVQESTLAYGPMELRFLNPLTIFHGMHNWKDYFPAGNPYGWDESACAYLAVKASYAVTNNLRIYGLYAQDQLQLPSEMERDSDTTPNAMGGQLGVESFIPLSDGYLHSRLEGYYAMPYLYIKESPNWSMARGYTENIGYSDPEDALYEWIGSPFGPDTAAAKLSVGYEVPGRWSLTATGLFMARGEMSGTKVFDNKFWRGRERTNFGSNWDVQTWAFPNAKTQGDGAAKDRQGLSTPSTYNGGATEYVLNAALKLTYEPFDYLSLQVQPSYTYVMNSVNVEGKTRHGPELSVSIKIRVPEMFRK